ncbi:MAG: phospholipase D-like domain-containing protein [Acidobacteriota bacterium]
MHSRSVSVVVLSSLLVLLTGCTMPIHEPALSSSTDTTFTAAGRVHGGQQPVAGASVQLYTVSTSGDATAATALLSTPATTDANGSFTLTGQYSCTNATQVFLIATGGNPGGGLPNPNLKMMTALGSCSSLTSSTFINVNELTTTAAVSALHLFMSSPTNIGASAYDSPSLAQDFTLATQLVDFSSGRAPGVNIPSGFSAPAALINTLGDIVAPCINSSGGTAGDSTACGQLFTLTTPPNGTAPTDTITALLNVVNHPTLNTTALFGLITSDAPFQTSLSAAPASYAVALNAPAFTITRSLLVEPDDGVQALYDLVNNAKSTIDMTVYGLQDTIFSGDLVAACQRGVTVRVILDQKYEKSTDQAAYDQLNAQPGCTAVWADKRYVATHEKTFAVDNTTLALLTLNVETRDYPGTRDFAVISNDPQDVAAFEGTFNSDFGMNFPYATTQGTDLIWSPTTAQTDMVGIINNATRTLEVENEEMSATKIVTALEAACQRGVQVSITMTNQTSYHTNFSALEAAGCGVHVFPNSVHSLYIHAKVIIADYGTPAQVAYLGSINFSLASMVENRELGMYLYDTALLHRLESTLNADYAAATAY